jgi:CDP-6-deoxy-D-xylo-4-hexulose-3-dehydrase
MGFNVKITDIQAAIGWKQMDRLNSFVSKRRKNFEKIEKIFSKYDYFVKTEKYKQANPSWFGYIITLKEGCAFTRNEMTQYFTSHGVLNRYFFCGNITKQSVFVDTDRFKYRVSGELKWTDYMMENSFWIGCHPKVDSKQIKHIEKTLDNFVKEQK